MHFQGKEVISRSTHVAHRSLISVASIAIISLYFELDLTDITVFGLNLTEDSIAPITFIILIFLLVNYILNYSGDYVSFKNWNIDLEQKTAYGVNNLTTEYKNALLKIKNIKKSFKDITDGINNGRMSLPASFDEVKKNVDKINKGFPNITEEMKTLNPKVENLIKGHSQLNFFAKIQLYGWYGLVTAGLVVWALCLIAGHYLERPLI